MGTSSGWTSITATTGGGGVAPFVVFASELQPASRRLGTTAAANFPYECICFNCPAFVSMTASPDRAALGAVELRFAGAKRTVIGGPFTRRIQWGGPLVRGEPPARHKDSA